jgi:hypothetical protein
MKTENPIYGVVRTTKNGSGSTFYVCEQEDWEKLNEKEQNKLLIEAMWESGVVDVYVSEE